MGQHRANTVQAFIRQLWCTLRQCVGHIPPPCKCQTDLPRWNYQSECSKIIDDGGRVEHRWYGPEGMEDTSQNFDSAESVFRHLSEVHLCPACEEAAQMKGKMDRSEQVRLNRLQRDYTQDELPNQEQIRFDFGWLAGLVLRLNDQVEKAAKKQ